jgi:hypothetical protein
VSNPSIPSSPAPQPPPGSSSYTVEIRDYFLALMGAMQRENDVRFSAMKEATASALAAAEKATAAALDAAQRAVTKAESAVDKRLEGMNEFRGALQDVTTTLMPRAESENRMNQLARDLAALQARIDRQEGRGSGMSSLWGLILGAIGLVAAVIAIASRFTN